MSRWDALRPERGECTSTTRSSSSVASFKSSRTPRLHSPLDATAAAASKTQTSAPVSFQQQQQQPKRQTEKAFPAVLLDSKLDELKFALREGKERTILNAIEELEAIIDTNDCALEAIPPKHAGEAVFALISGNDSSSNDVLVVAQQERLELACRILATATTVPLVFTNRQVQECVRVLLGMDPSFSNRRDCHKHIDTRRHATIECLSRLVLVACRQMPAEETATNLVGRTLLPILEDRSVLDGGNNERMVSIVWKAIHRLLSDSLHASALLAPLTVDITMEGHENVMTNPLCIRLFRAMEGLLQHESYSHNACQSLIQLLQAVTNSTTGSTRGDACDEVLLDPSVLKSFVVETLRTRDRPRKQRTDMYKLLRLALNTQPSASTSIALSSLLIGDGRLPLQETGGATCVHCQYPRTVSPLLDSLHDADDDEDETASIISCLQEMLKSLPLHIWLGNGRSNIGLQQFGNRTFHALIHLIRVVKCRLRRSPLSLPALCPLIQVFLTRIPFSHEESHEMTCNAMDLLSQITAQARAQAGAGLELVECLVICAGGRPRPEGGITPMSVPLKLWLLSVQSLGFRENVWRSAESITSVRREEAMQILRAIVRSLPSFVLTDDEIWHRFQGVVLAHTSHSSPRLRLDGASFLELFLAGRLDGDRQPRNDREIALFASSVARTLLTDTKAQVRMVGLNCYGSLLPHDWRALSENDVDVPFARQVGEICSHCVSPRETCMDGEGNASVRSAACRCVGNICTQYLSLSIVEEETEAFCRGVCETLCKSLDDSNVGVRSMTVFAIGNLVHILRERDESSHLMIPPGYIILFCRKVVACLDESNSKVVGNAIRACGHLASLIFHPPLKTSIGLDEWDAHVFYRGVLCALNRKVEAALASEKRQGFTWKQRSTINKQAWGSCHSLMLVLDCDEAVLEVNIAQAQDSLAILVQCIDKADVVHEKVASAAAAAIRKISHSMLTRISEGSGIVGTALAPCLLQLYQKRKGRGQKNQSRLSEELGLLLGHLLQASTILDACVLLKHCDVEKGAMAFLYDWMVNEGLPLRSFETFALSLQRKDLMDDAALQQRFASRALQMSRSSTDETYEDALQDPELGSTIDDGENDEL